MSAKVYNYRAGSAYYKVHLKTGFYADAREALFMVDAKDGSMVAKCTVNLTNAPPEGCVHIKTWSENEGMLDFLLKHEIVEQGVGFKIPTGHVEAALVRKGKNWPCPS